MPVTFNLRHIEKKSLTLSGELPPAELDLDQADELIHPNHPMEYDLQIERSSKGVLVQGKISITMDCECARCLTPFKLPIRLDPWTCHLPLEGEEKTPVSNDCVDLTPYLREHIVLAFPQHPLCHADCQGLRKSGDKTSQTRGDASEPDKATTPWSELDKLKF